MKTLTALLLTLAVLVLPVQAKKFTIQPVTIWVFLQDNEIRGGDSTNAYVFYQNPFPTDSKYRIEVTLSDGSETFPLLSAVVHLQPFDEGILTIRITPPRLGNWKVIASSTKVKPRPSYSITNSAYLSVIKWEIE